MVTPGWIRRGTRTWDERDGIVGVVAVAGGSVVVVGGLVVVDGVVSSAAAIGASRTKSTTEQGRTAAVASRRIRLSVSRPPEGRMNDLLCADRREDPRIVRDDAGGTGRDDALEVVGIVDRPGEDGGAERARGRDRTRGDERDAGASRRSRPRARASRGRRAGIAARSPARPARRTGWSTGRRETP